MPLKLFEFQKHFTIDNFLIQLTQFEKTGSIIFYSAGNSENYSLFKLKIIQV